VRRTWLPALLIVAGAWLLQRQHILNHDVGQFLYAGRMALSGEGRIYRDFVEFNLPLVSYLTALPAEVAAWLGIDQVTSVVTAVFLGAIGSTALTLSILAAAGIAESTLTVAATLMLAGLLGLSQPHLGQREHLLAMLAAPWLAAVAVGGRGSVAAALLAGLGFALKPHFLLLPAAVLLAAGGWRLAVPAVAVALACHAATLALFPEYLSAIVPMAARFYAAWQVPPWRLLAEPAVVTAVAAAALGLRLAPGRGALVLAGAVLGGIAVFAGQARGYDYHRLPLLLAAMAMVALPALRRPALGLLLAAMAAAPLGRALEPWPYVQVVRRLAPEVRSCPPPAWVAAFSMHTFPLFPLLDVAGGRNALRYPSLWMWPAIDGSSSLRLAADEARPFLRDVVADLRAHPPCLIVVDDNSWGDRPHPIVPMLSAEAGFVEFWADYRQSLTVGGYTVWRRAVP